jgi:hypothetical protein
MRWMQCRGQERQSDCRSEEGKSCHEDGKETMGNAPWHRGREHARCEGLPEVHAKEHSSLACYSGKRNDASGWKDEFEDYGKKRRPIRCGSNPVLSLNEDRNQNEQQSEHESAENIRQEVTSEVHPGYGHQDDHPRGRPDQPGPPEQDRRGTARRNGRATMSGGEAVRDMRLCAEVGNDIRGEEIKEPACAARNEW